MKTIIIPATVADLPFIYHLFEEAILFQKKNNYTGWKSYDKTFIEKDTREGLLFKLVHGSVITGIFCVCYTDALIWRTMEQGDAIYLHRIVSNRAYTAGKIFGDVLEWAIDHAMQKQLAHIRMDTWAENVKIINFYKSYGFRFIENFTTADTEDLPLQHRKLKVALLELEVPVGNKKTCKN